MATARSETIGVSTGELFRGERVGRYEILTQLSVGGMAELFLAFTAGPGGFKKYAVIKRILPDARNNESFVRMFLDEARITAALNHPNIAQVFELGGEQEDALFLAMEFIAGQNLNQVVSACLKSGRPRLPAGFSAAVARDLCNALHYAHNFTDGAGNPSPIIHRDVAQKNVMVTYDGVVKLLDFGIAKAKGSLGKTSVGMVKGTTGYMSPEQVRGEELDGRSDVFSVGVMLFEVLTGRRLFSAETEAEEMERILSAPIPDPTGVEPALPRALGEVVMKALARRRDERFVSAKAMARALEAAMGDALYDEERIAALMRELFTEKMKATRALLDSAGKEEVTEVRRAALALTEDSGSVFPGEQVRTGPTHRALQDVPAGTPPAVPVIQVPPPVPPPPSEAKSLPWRPIALVGAIVAGSVILVSVVGAVLAPKDGVPADPRAAFGAEVASGTPLKTATSARTGTLTLLTEPQSTVIAGPNTLGRTPLIAVELPVGSHLLMLEGPDGEKRILTVQIRPGQNTAMKVELETLPTRAPFDP